MSRPEQDPLSQPTNPGISGRKLTIAVVAALVIVGASLSFTLWSYNRIQTSRKQMEGAWTNVVDRLSERYQSAERLIADAIDERQMDMRLGERFRLEIDRFRSSVQPSVQLEAAQQLESLLDEAGQAIGSDASTSKLVAGFNDAVGAYERELDSWGGSLVSAFLNLPEPNRLELGQ